MDYVESAMSSRQNHPREGWRERKRSQTRLSIAEAGLGLFLKQGFEATTLDAIAEAAGIARRTFFHYFDSKEALIFAYDDEAEKSFRAALAGTPKDMLPMDVMTVAIQAMIATFGTAKARAIDRLAHSCDVLHARKQLHYQRLETLALSALVEKWPAPDRHLPLRLVAMAGVGAIRIAVDQWREDDGTRPLQDYVNDTLAILRTQYKS